MNPLMVSAMVHLVRDTLDLYEARRDEKNGRMDRDQLIEICVKSVLGRTEFDRRSVLDADPHLTVPRATTLVHLFKLAGDRDDVQLGKLVSALGIPKQTAYARLNALIARGYAMHDAGHRGSYLITEKGKATARLLTRDEPETTGSREIEVEIDEPDVKVKKRA